MSSNKGSLTVDAIAQKLREALKASELGRGSYSMNYDPNVLSTAVQKIIDETSVTPKAPSVCGYADGLYC